MGLRIFLRSLRRQAGGGGGAGGSVPKFGCSKVVNLFPPLMERTLLGVPLIKVPHLVKLLKCFFVLSEIVQFRPQTAMLNQRNDNL